MISTAMGVIWFGAIFGNIAFTIFADNFGRRKALILCQIWNVAGYTVLLTSSSLLQAEIGLFIIGMGFQGLFPIMLCILEEILDNSLRQKMQIFIQSFICLGSLFSIILFYTIKDWWSIYFYFGLLPVVGCLIFTLFYAKETPQFMVEMYPVDRIREDMRFIARQNGRER